MSWLIKSKKFWIGSILIGSVSAIKIKDNQNVKRIKRELLMEAKKLGDMPSYDNDPIRKLILIKSIKASLSSKQEMEKKGESAEQGNNDKSDSDINNLVELFNRYSLYLLTAAGVDYQWIEIQDGNNDEINNFNNENGGIDNFKNKINANWILDLLGYINGKINSLPISIERTFSSNSSLFPHSTSHSTSTTINTKKNYERIFLDGIIALDRESFDKILSQQRAWIKENRPNNILTILPRTGIIDCNGFHWRDRWYGRLYWWFNKSHIATKLGQQTISILKEEIIIDKEGIPIYKQS